MQQTSPQTPVSPSAGADLSTLDFDDSFTRSLPADPEGRNFVRQVAAASYSNVTPTTVSALRLLQPSRSWLATVWLPQCVLTRPDMAATNLAIGLVSWVTGGRLRWAS